MKIWIAAVSLYVSFSCVAQPSIQSGLVVYDELDRGTTAANSLLGGQATYIGPTSAPIAIDATGASGTEGTILFWVRPRYAFHDTAVHTYLFSAMNTPQKNEFVVADGWWPAASAPNWWDDGSNWLYFIHRDTTGNPPHVRTNDVNVPVERAHASASDNRWKFMAVTWKQGSSGALNFYVNGRIPPNERSMQRTGLPALADFLTESGKKTIYLGNSPAQNRGADAEFDKLSIYSRALSGAEIEQIYEEYLPTTWQAYRDSDWMEPETSQVFAPVVDANGVPIENRVIFDETALFLIRGVDDVIDKIKAAHMNVYVPNIWHGRGARWQLVPGTTAAEDGYDAKVFCSFTGTPSCSQIDAAASYAGADPFAELIAKAHAEGIEVHPWFTLFLYQWGVASQAGKHIDSAHAGWTYQIPGGTDVAYSPTSAGYLAYIKAKILDVVTRYDIDGINLDYVRYLYDLNPQSQSTDIAARKAAVAAAVEDIVTAVHAVKPNLVISVDGGVASEFDHRLAKMDDTLGRNQTEWLKAGLIDVVFDMDYSPTLNVPKFDRARSYVAPEKTPHSVVKLLGDYESPSPGVVYARDAGLLADLVHFSQVKWPGTVAVYWMDELYRDTSLVTALASGPFQQPARTLWKFDGPRVTAKLSSPDTPVENLPINFEAEAIHIDDGDVSASIDWIAEGTGLAAVNIGTGASASHAFATGTYQVHAQVEDAMGHISESAKLTVAVAPKSSQSISVTAVAPTSAAQNDTFSVAATASSTLPVAITVSGGCSIAGGVVTMTSATVSCVVHYDQPGDAHFNAAAQVSSTTTATAPHGLTGTFYNGTAFNAAVLARIDANIDFNWGFSSPASGVNADYFSVRWTGRLAVPVTGTYEFCVLGDDGIQLSVNDTMLLNFWLPQDSVTHCATATLNGGQTVPIALNFFDDAEEAIVQLRWSYPGQSSVVVPSSALYAQ